VFSKGFNCLHCAEQINVFSSQQENFSRRGVQIVFLISDSESKIKSVLGTRPTKYQFVADADRVLAMQLGQDTAFAHGIMCFNKNGRRVWATASEFPLVDVTELLRVLDQL